MATQLNIRGAYVKQRNPLGILGLNFITLGIYSLYWYYEINRELRDLGEDVSPGMSLLAVMFGWMLIVPPFLSFYNTGERIKRQQRAAGMHQTTSGAFVITMLLLSWLFIPALVLYYSLQSHLNRLYAQSAGAAALPGSQPAGQLGAAWPEQPATQPEA